MFHGNASSFVESRKPGEARAAVSSDQGSWLFQDLIDSPIAMLPGIDGQPSVQRTKEALEDIASRMVGPNDREDLPGALGATPAAFTYFGQFVFHDMVFSRVFGMSTGHRLENAVSFGLDLSGLYGRGPTVDGHLYEAPTRDRPGTCRFPLGLPRATGAATPVDPAIEKGRDLPRVDMSSSFISALGRPGPYRPLVADPRNDNNLVLSQLQATLMLIHNRLVDVQLDAGVNADAAFITARNFLTGAYRRAVMHDYLKRLLHPRIWALFFKETGDFRGPFVEKLRPLTGLPVEFTFAASRFAHSMVRQSYHVNREFDVEPGRLDELLSFSSQREDGDVPIPVRWVVDWRRFSGEGEGVQRARRISPFLPSALTNGRFKLATDGDRPRSVAFMDCWRCYDHGLPTGQTVAKAIGRMLRDLPAPDSQPADVPVLSGDAMLPTEACMRRYPNSAAALAGALRKVPEFLTDTPLSYYILQEASADEEGGNRLGHVGSYIVGATVASSLFLAASDSEVTAHDMTAGTIRTLAGLLELHEKSDDDLKILLG